MRQWHGSHYAQLVEEAKATAAKPGEMMIEGVRMILEADALWKAQCQEMDGHLRAAGHQPSANMGADHEMAEVVRLLTKFGGKVSPPLPHSHGIQLREQEEATKRRMREQAAV